MKILRMVMALFILLALCGSNIPSQAAEQSMIEKAEKRGTLRVGVSSFVPWTMQDKNGEYVGFEIDVAKRLAKDLGLKIELVPTRFNGIIPALLADKFDIIVGSMSVTPERNLQGNFSIPYDYATIEVMANKEKTNNLKKFPEDYNNPEVIVAVRSGSTPALLAKKLLPKATIRTFDDEAPAVQDVVSGRSHIMLSSAPLPAQEVIKHPDILWQPTKEPLSKQPVGFVIRKGDYDSMNVLDNWIRLVEEEGWLQDRRNYWFKSLDWKENDK